MAEAVEPEWVDEWVYKASTGNGSGGAVLHFEEDCRMLDYAKSVLRKPRKSFPDDVQVCTVCGPGEEP